MSACRMCPDALRKGRDSMKFFGLNDSGLFCGRAFVPKNRVVSGRFAGVAGPGIYV